MRDSDLTHHSSQNSTIVRGAFGDRFREFFGCPDGRSPWRLFFFGKIWRSRTGHLTESD
ncbi:hypothetical protein [Planktothricoides raciborskii]|uniref:hypothetical protein n=1 Tax=Planktothricoides raciborskii TaxID=132608 RepID=UPI0018D17BCB|nr:hypothetical protein [Planktothricoides raciborskii]